MDKFRSLLSFLAGLAACAAGLALLWLELFVWGKARTNVLELGAALALMGGIWAAYRAFVALGMAEEPRPDDDAKAQHGQDKPGPT